MVFLKPKGIRKPDYSSEKACPRFSLPGIHFYLFLLSSSNYSTFKGYDKRLNKARPKPEGFSLENNIRRLVPISFCGDPRDAACAACGSTFSSYAIS